MTHSCTCKIQRAWRETLLCTNAQRIRWQTSQVTKRWTWKSHIKAMDMKESYQSDGHERVISRVSITQNASCWNVCMTLPTKRCVQMMYVWGIVSAVHESCKSHDVDINVFVMYESWCSHHLAVSQGKWTTHHVAIYDSYILIIYESWRRQYVAVVAASQMAGTRDAWHTIHDAYTCHHTWRIWGWHYRWRIHQSLNDAFTSHLLCEWVVTLAGSNATSHYLVNGAYTNHDDACNGAYTNDNDACMHQSSNDACTSQLITYTPVIQWRIHVSCVVWRSH